MPYRIDLHTDTPDGKSSRSGSVPGFPLWIDDEPDAFHLTVDEKRDALVGALWFLDHAADGLTLTAGWMKPADVEALAAVLPEATRWIGKRNREDLTVPVARFRQAMHDLGLICEAHQTACGATSLR